MNRRYAVTFLADISLPVKLVATEPPENWVTQPGLSTIMADDSDLHAAIQTAFSGMTAVHEVRDTTWSNSHTSCNA